MKTLSYLNFILAALFVACYCYQIIFSGVRLLRKRKVYTAKKLCRYAVLIAARNESAVIAQLIESVRAQDYPADLVDIYVVADNCTDNTAEVATAAGATVYVRENKEKVGKGYALNYLLGKIKEEHEDAGYDGYFVFDADNLLDSRYITEMNKVFTNGYQAVTSYRNSKNFGDNWITAGYGMWFLRESEYLNAPRHYLGTSCAVSGTGFLFSNELLEKNGGWNYFLLTEDLQFTADMVAQGEKIGYCSSAIIYDEQPRGFRQSIVQRSRWVKGYMQVIAKHGGDMFKRMASSGSFACYDMLMNTLPVVVLTVMGVILNTVMFILSVISGGKDLDIFFFSIIAGMVNSYATMYLMGILVLGTEWKNIHCSRGKKIRYSFTFPFFVYTFGLAMVVAVFGNIEWKPIKHTVALSISDIGGNSQK